MLLFCRSFALLLVFAQVVPAQGISHQLPMDTLATIGPQVLRAKDFLERFELMPWPKKDAKGRLEYSKLEFLYSLVAEKLLSFEATTKDIGSDTSTQMMKYGMERLFVRDELYKREVFPRIDITPAEIQGALARYAWEMRVQLLGIATRQEGDALYKKANSSHNPDSTLAFFRDSLYTILDTITVDFGGKDFSLENEVYNMGAKKLSRPFTSDMYGLIMVRVLLKYTNPKYVNASKPDQVTAVKNILRGRQEDSLSAKTFSAFLTPQRAEADPALFKILADSVYSMMITDSAGHRSKGLYVFSSRDIELLIPKLRQYHTSPFITAKSGVMTLREVLEMLQYNRVVFPSLSKNIVEAILNNNIKTVVQNELLSREGFQRNLQQSEQVRHDVAQWMDSRRALLLTARVVDTVEVSEREVLDYYSRNATLFGAKVEVNIREILVDSVKLAQELRRRIDKGEEMSALARQYSKRKEWGDRGGESGFFPVTEHGDLGFYASNADSGQDVGPLRIKEGITIFRVLEKRQHLDSMKQNFEQVKRTAGERLLKQKRQHTLDKYIAGLAKKYGVVIYETNLHGVKTTSTSMFTWRHIGWGGVMVAVPSVNPQVQWIQEWRRPQTINP